MKVHPAAECWPMLEGEELQSLADDIKQFGLRQPIILWKKQLLDGRNRLAACKLVDVKPEFADIPDDTDPVAFVISANEHRRHCSQSQLAMAAAKLADIPHGGDRKSEDSEIKAQNCTSIDEAADSLKVSSRSVQSAKKVIANGSKEVQKAVERGEMPVSKAEKLVKAEPDKKKQTAAVKAGKQAVNKAVASGKAKQAGKRNGKAVASSAELVDAIQRKHFSGRDGLPQALDAVAKANGGKGPQYEIANAGLNKFLGALKKMRGGTK